MNRYLCLLFHSNTSTRTIVVNNAPRECDDSAAAKHNGIDAWRAYLSGFMVVSRDHRINKGIVIRLAMANALLSAKWLLGGPYTRCENPDAMAQMPPLTDMIPIEAAMVIIR